MPVSDPSRGRQLALVGSGPWGREVARHFHTLGVLRTVCDTDAAALAAFEPGLGDVERTGSLQDVLDDPAITKIAVGVPVAQRYEVVKAGLEAGMDLFVREPLCLRASEAEEVVALAERRGRVLMVGHFMRYHPCVEQLQALLSQGELGRLQYVTLNRLSLDKLPVEPILWSFSAQDFSVILALAGDDLPLQVRCVGGAFLNDTVADTTLTTFKFSNGLRGHVFASRLHPFKEHRLTAVGSNGMLVFDDLRPWKEKLFLHRQHITWTHGHIPTPNRNSGVAFVVPEADPMREACRDFLACCRQRRAPRTDGRDGLRVLQVLQMMRASLAGDGEALSATGENGGLRSVTLGSGSWQAQASFYAHPTAVIDPGAVIGEGTKIWHFAHVCAGTRIGGNCSIGQNTYVASRTVIGSNVRLHNNTAVYVGTTIEDDVFIGPSCVLANVVNPRSLADEPGSGDSTLVSRGATIGANATVFAGVTLGRHCSVAAGSVVTHDVPDYAVIAGVPARQTGWIGRHGHLLQPGTDGLLVCPKSGFRYAQVHPGTLRCLDLDENEPLPAGGRPAARGRDHLSACVGDQAPSS